MMMGFDGSGKSRTDNPLESLYSVMPSTEVTYVTPEGRRRLACAESLETGVGKPAENNRRNKNGLTKIFMMYWFRMDW